MAAAIFAAQATPGIRVVLLEGAQKPGAKILVSGGGRCNVTNKAIRPEDYSGGPPTIIRKVLLAFDEERTFTWMRSMGVQLKLEPTGKFFPTTDDARTILDALLKELRRKKVDLRLGVRVNRILTGPEGFEIYANRETPEVVAPRVIVATGGLALPKSGSDGAGLRWMRALGHNLIPTTPALAPLLVTSGPWGEGPPADLTGLTLEARLSLQSSAGKKIADCLGSLLFTHFGLSGPAAMNLSRHIARFRLEHPDDPGQVGLGCASLSTPEEADEWLVEQIRIHPKRNVSTVLRERWPDRLADLFAAPYGRLGDLSREQRLDLARSLVFSPIGIEGDRGYAFAETTAGGVDLRDIDPATMESRIVPGLYLCGEMLDVDGRIGGFNFQWAWATGHLAGRAAATAAAISAESLPPSAESPAST